MHEFLKMAFEYTTGWVALATTAGGTTQATIQFAAGTDFACNFLTGHVRQANVLVSNWAGSVQVDLSGTGRTLFSDAIAFDAIAGNGRQPYPFDPPKLFKGGSTIQITFTNNVVTAGDVELVFHGNKIRPGGNGLGSAEL